MVALGQDRGDLDNHGAIMEVMHGGDGTPLSAVRSCGMGLITCKALDMYGSPYLIIPYLLRGEQGNLMVNFIKVVVFRYIGKHSKTLAFS